MIGLGLSLAKITKKIIHDANLFWENVNDFWENVNSNWES